MSRFLFSILAALVVMIGSSVQAQTISCFEITPSGESPYYRWLHDAHGLVLNARSGWSTVDCDGSMSAGCDDSDCYMGVPPGQLGAGSDYYPTVPTTCTCDVVPDANGKAAFDGGSCGSYSTSGDNVLCVTGNSTAGDGEYKLLEIPGSTSGFDVPSGHPNWWIPKPGTGTPKIARLALVADYNYIYGMEFTDPNEATFAGDEWQNWSAPVNAGQACVIIQGGDEAANAAKESRLIDNEIHHCQGDGIYITGGEVWNPRVHIIWNDIHDNGENGAHVVSSASTCSSTNCASLITTNNAGGAGIRVNKLNCGGLFNQCIVEGNSITDNGEDGIILEATSRFWFLRYNDIHRNGADSDATKCYAGFSGIRTNADPAFTAGPSSNTLQANFSNDNADACYDGYGILLDSLSDGNLIAANILTLNDGPGFGTTGANDNLMLQNAQYWNNQDHDNGFRTDTEIMFTESVDTAPDPDDTYESYENYYEDGEILYDDAETTEVVDTNSGTQNFWQDGTGSPADGCGASNTDDCGNNFVKFSD